MNWRTEVKVYLAWSLMLLLIAVVWPWPSALSFALLSLFCGWLAQRKYNQNKSKAIPNHSSAQLKPEEKL